MKLLEQLGTVAGGALGSSFGPIGTMVGQGIGRQLGDKADDLLSQQGSRSSSGDWQTCVEQQPGLQDSGLRTNGSNVVDTGRYLISFKDGEVTVTDKLTNKSFRAWGDPHLTTSDGDKAQFHENLTIDLEDGTKMTIKATPKNANGIAWIDSVAIMKGSQAVVVNGLTGKDGFQMGNVLNNADAVDAQMEDGTVLRAGHEVDDLTYAADGNEIVGTDPTQRNGEWNVDGKGGTSVNSPTVGNTETQTDPAAPNDPTEPTDPTAPTGPSGTSGLSLWDLLWQIIDKLGKLVEKRATSLLKKQKEMEKYEEDKAKAEAKDKKAEAAYEKEKAAIEEANQDLPDDQKRPLPDPPESEAAKMKAPYSEAELKKEMADVQRFQEMIGQMTTMMTNMQKTDHDSKMNIAGNMK